MKILIDNGHGENTPGKCSPDGRLKEWNYTREIFVRQPMPGGFFWTQNLAICRDTICPAILTENFFQDNKADVAYLLSDEGKRTIVQIHVDGVLNYLNSNRK